MSTYRGIRLGKGGPGSSVKVMKIDDEGASHILDPCIHIVNHSPDGFEWGYGGSGPSQLALAILVDHCVDDRALRLYQKFKVEFVSSWKDSWEINSEEIELFLNDHYEENL